jgi:hypothetical protein
MSSETQLLDSGGAPSGFTSDAPFKKKARKKDSAASALKGLAGLGVVLCVLAVVMAFMTM